MSVVKSSRNRSETHSVALVTQRVVDVRHKTVSEWMGGGQITADGGAAGSGRSKHRACSSEAALRMPGRQRFPECARAHGEGRDLAMEIACCYTEGPRKPRGLRRAEICW